MRLDELLDELTIGGGEEGDTSSSSATPAGPAAPVCFAPAGAPLPSVPQFTLPGAAAVDYSTRGPKRVIGATIAVEAQGLVAAECPLAGCTARGDTTADLVGRAQVATRTPLSTLLPEHSVEAQRPVQHGRVPGAARA